MGDFRLFFMLKRHPFLPFDALALDDLLGRAGKVEMADGTFRRLVILNQGQTYGTLADFRSRFFLFFAAEIQLQFHRLADDDIQSQIIEILLGIFTFVLGTVLGNNGLRTFGKRLNQIFGFFFRQIIVQAGVDALAIDIRRIRNINVVKFILFLHCDPMRYKILLCYLKAGI